MTLAATLKKMNTELIFHMKCCGPLFYAQTLVINMVEGSIRLLFPQLIIWYETGNDLDNHMHFNLRIKAKMK